MRKKIKIMIKYFTISVAYAVFYGIISVLRHKPLDIRGLIISSAILFVLLYVLAIVAPLLRKLLGYENKR
jgi:hypothetical protein